MQPFNNIFSQAIYNRAPSLTSKPVNLINNPSINVLIIPEFNEYEHTQVLFGMRCLWEVGLWGVDSFSLYGKEEFYPDGYTVDSKLKLGGFVGSHSSNGIFVLDFKSDGLEGAKLELEDSTWTSILMKS